MTLLIYGRQTLGVMNKESADKKDILNNWSTNKKSNTAQSEVNHTDADIWHSLTSMPA